MKFTAGQLVAHRKCPAIRVTVACPKPDRRGNIVIRRGDDSVGVPESYSVQPEVNWVAVHPLTPQPPQANP